MYRDEQDRQRREVKIRILDVTHEAIRDAADRVGMQPASWLRAVVEIYLADDGYQIPGLHAAVMKRRLRMGSVRPREQQMLKVVQSYLVDQGYELDLFAELEQEKQRA